MFICRFTELIWAKSRWPVRLTDLVLCKNTQPPIKCQSEVFECILHHFDFLFQFAKRRGSLQAEPLCQEGASQSEGFQVLNT